MAAFRLGKIPEAHDLLVDIQNNQKNKELLAQGYSRNQEKSAQYELEENKRQIPFHMQINLQVLDCSYLVCAMLLEIPNYAQHQFTMNKFVISRSFKRLIENYDQRAFHLAAEQYRDSVVMAARSLNKSDWRSAVNHIMNISFFKRQPQVQVESLNAMLTRVFKESALKAFLFRAARQYESFGIVSLSKLFEMPEQDVTKFSAKMIISNQLQVHIDRDQGLVVMDQQTLDTNEL